MKRGQRQWKVEAQLLWMAAQPQEIPDSYAGVMPPNKLDFFKLYKAIRDNTLANKRKLKEL